MLRVFIFQYISAYRNDNSYFCACHLSFPPLYLSLHPFLCHLLLLIRSSRHWRRTPRPRRCSSATDCSRSQPPWRIRSLTCDRGSTHQSRGKPSGLGVGGEFRDLHPAGWTEKQESNRQTNGKIVPPFLSGGKAGVEEPWVFEETFFNTKDQKIRVGIEVHIPAPSVMSWCWLRMHRWL